MATIYTESGTEIFTNPMPAVVAKHRVTTLYGTYYGHSGNLTVLAAAHGSTAGFMWLFNPTASGKILKIILLRIKEGMTTALATPTAPRITVERMTSTTNPSGAQITVAKGNTSDAANVGYLTLVTTGLTITAGGVIGAFIVQANATAGANTGGLDEVIIGEKADVKDLELVAGEGIVIRQVDAGTTSDTRKAVVDLFWQEYA